MAIRILLILCLMISCTSTKKTRSAKSLVIIQVNGNADTALVKAEIFKLARTYDLESFLYTRHIVINPRVPVHSHPVLTIDTRFVKDRDKLLSQLLHEELHWWMEQNLHKVQVAMPEFKSNFKDTPKIKGSKDPNSTYRHLIICWMEYMAITKYLGEDTAKKNLNYFISQNRYPWIYKKVLTHGKVIQEIVGKYKFIPDELFLSGYVSF